MKKLNILAAVAAIATLATAPSFASQAGVDGVEEKASVFITRAGINSLAELNLDDSPKSTFVFLDRGGVLQVGDGDNKGEVMPGAVEQVKRLQQTGAYVFAYTAHGFKNHEAENAKLLAQGFDFSKSGLEVRNRQKNPVGR